MTEKTTLALAAVLLTIGLGACSSASEEATPAEANRIETIDQPEPTPVETSEPSPAPSATPEVNVTAEAPPEVAPRPEEQMLDDASATGMTARASREEAGSNDDAPLAQDEEK